jgi:hypothetical protein
VPLKLKVATADVEVETAETLTAVKAVDKASAHNTIVDVFIISFFSTPLLFNRYCGASPATPQLGLFKSSLPFCQMALCN